MGESTVEYYSPSRRVCEMHHGGDEEGTDQIHLDQTVLADRIDKADLTRSAQMDTIIMELRSVKTVMEESINWANMSDNVGRSGDGQDGVMELVKVLIAVLVTDPQVELATFPTEKIM